MNRSTMEGDQAQENILLWGEGKDILLTPRTKELTMEQASETVREV